MNVLPRNRRRHWKQRFDPTSKLVFLRPTRLSLKGRFGKSGTETFGVGDDVPSGVDERTLGKLWGAERIALAEFEPPPEKISREGLIVQAVGKLDPQNPMHWTATGKPRVEVLEGMLSFDITGKERDAAHAKWLKAQKKG